MLRRDFACRGKAEGFANQSNTSRHDRDLSQSFIIGATSAAGGGLDESLRKCRAEEVVSRLILYLASPDRSWRNPTHLNSGRDQPQVGRNRPDFGRNGPQLGRTEQQSDDRVQIARMLKEQG